MSDEPDNIVSLGTVTDVPAPTEDAPHTDPVTPDHTASKDESIVDRVKRRTRERSGSSSTRDAVKPAKKATPKTRTATRTATDKELTDALTQVYAGVGMALMTVDPTCANAVLSSAEKCAQSVVAVSKTNDAVRRALIALTATSAWGGVLIAHLPILLAVAMHHGPKEVRERVSFVAPLVGVPPIPTDTDQPTEGAA